MALTQEAKSRLIKAFGKQINDTGSCEVQIGMLSERIKEVAEHLKTAKKDYSSQRGLLLMVGKRRTFLRYLKHNDEESYNNVVASLKEHGYMK